MTPKEKANELFSKYFLALRGYGPIEREQARANAMITVNELYRIAKWGGDIDGEIEPDSKEYYELVKGELKNIPNI